MYHTNLVLVQHAGDCLHSVSTSHVLTFEFQLYNIYVCEVSLEWLLRSFVVCDNRH